MPTFCTPRRSGWRRQLWREMVPWCLRCRAPADVWTLDYEARSAPYPFLAAWSARDLPVNYLAHHGERWREDAVWHAGTAHWPRGFGAFAASG